jgi:hypothetical protein
MRVQRAGLLLGSTGAALVMLAIFTDSRLTVAVGLVLVVAAHALVFVSAVRPRAGAPRR